MLDQDVARRKRWAKELKRRRKCKQERHSKSLRLQYEAHKGKPK